MHTLTIHYKPDDYPIWSPWKTFSPERFTLIGSIGAIDRGGVPSADPGFAPRVSFGKPPDDCDPTTERKLRRGYQFQVRFRGTGHVSIIRFRLHAQRLVEKSRATC